MSSLYFRHKFQAHDSAIRAIALDPTEEYFVTGSAEGDVKVWGLSVHNLLLSLPEEHKKQTFFRNSSNGVMQLDVDANNRLFSCGADGFFKIRSLQPADYVVQTLWWTQKKTNYVIIFMFAQKCRIIFNVGLKNLFLPWTMFFMSFGGLRFFVRFFPLFKTIFLLSLRISSNVFFFLSWIVIRI